MSLCSMTISISTSSRASTLNAALSRSAIHVMSTCMKGFEMNDTHGSSLSNLQNSRPSLFMSWEYFLQPCPGPQMQRHCHSTLIAQRESAAISVSVNVQKVMQRQCVNLEKTRSPFHCVTKFVWQPVFARSSSVFRLFHGYLILKIYKTPHHNPLLVSVGAVVKKLRFSWKIIEHNSYKYHNRTTLLGSCLWARSL